MEDSDNCENKFWLFALLFVEEVIILILILLKSQCRQQFWSTLKC